MMKVPNHVIFQKGCSEQAISQCLETRSTTIVTSQGTKARFLDDLLSRLAPTASQIIILPSHTPNFTSCSDAFDKMVQPTDCILAIGGGSVIDTAKVIALKRSYSDFSMVEKAIRNSSYKDDIESTPIVAIPTTAGTGSSITPWGTVWDYTARLKYSVNHRSLAPVKAFFDPELTLSAPRELTICCALDALSHAFESIWNLNKTPDSRAYARKSITLLLSSLEELANDLSNVQLRENVLQASMFAGLAFSQTKTSVAHALSYYLTLEKEVPHGIACSITLPIILEQYLQENTSSTLTLKDLHGLRGLFQGLGIETTLSVYGISKGEFDDFFSAGLHSPRMQNALIDLTALRERFFKSL